MLFKCSFLEFPSTTFRTLKQFNFFISIYFSFHLHQLLIEFPIFIKRNVFILIVVHIDDFHFTRFLRLSITATLRLISNRISSSWDIVIINNISSWLIIFRNFLLLIIIEIIIFSALFRLRLNLCYSLIPLIFPQKRLRELRFLIALIEITIIIVNIFSFSKVSCFMLLFSLISFLIPLFFIIFLFIIIILIL